MQIHVTDGSHDWFRFYFWLDDKVVRVFFFSQSRSVVSNAKPKQMGITFDIQVKTALFTQDSALLSDLLRIKVESIRYKDQGEKNESIWPRLFCPLWLI